MRILQILQINKENTKYLLFLFSCLFFVLLSCSTLTSNSTSTQNEILAIKQQVNFDELLRMYKIKKGITSDLKGCIRFRIHYCATDTVIGEFGYISNIHSYERYIMSDETFQYRDNDSVTIFMLNQSKELYDLCDRNFFTQTRIKYNSIENKNKYRKLFMDKLNYDEKEDTCEIQFAKFNNEITWR